MKKRKRLVMEIAANVGSVVLGWNASRQHKNFVQSTDVLAVKVLFTYIVLFLMGIATSGFARNAIRFLL